MDPIPVEKSGNPCIPSPCGPNSKCVDVGDTPACSCLPNYIGRPPNCRPECMSSSDCPANLACINQKCANPCIGACGINTQCTVIKHNPSCQCNIGYTGDPFSGCSFVQTSNFFYTKKKCVSEGIMQISYVYCCICNSLINCLLST